LFIVLRNSSFRRTFGTSTPQQENNGGGVSQHSKRLEKLQHDDANPKNKI
jgi:hypothetical protein